MLESIGALGTREAGEKRGEKTMLIYVDTPTHLRVYRIVDNANGQKNVIVGRIPKTTYEFVKDPKGEFPSEEEEIDIRRVVELHRDAQQTKLRAEALSFPELARRTAEFYAASTDDVERRLISTAVMRMARAIRKINDGASANPSAPAS